MKYNLLENTRYLLRENYLLNERFVLNEAITEVEINNLIKLLDNVKTAFTRGDTEKETDDALEELWNIASTLDAQCKGANDPENIKGKLRDALTKLTNLSNKININGQTGKDIFKDKANVNSLDKLWDLAAAAPVKGENERKWAKAEKDVIKEIRQWAEILFTIVDGYWKSNNVDRTPQTNSIYNNIESATTALNLLIKATKLSVNPVTPTAEIEELITNGTKLCQSFLTGTDEEKESHRKTIEELCEKLAKTIDIELTRTGAKDQLDSTEDASKIDWAKRFKEATDKESFWRSYFKEYWGKYTDKIVRIGNLFREHCEKFGFTDKTNPFIVFLKRCFDNGWTVSETVYLLINNALVYDYITKDELLKYDDAHAICLINCADIYKKSDADARGYFELIGKIKNLHPLSLLKNETDDEVKNIVSHLGQKNSPNIKQFMWVVLFECISFDNLIQKNPDPTKTIDFENVKLLNVKTIKLRPLENVRAILLALNPSGANEKAIDTEGMDKLINRIAALKNPPVEAAKWLRKVVSYYILDTEAIQIYRDYAAIDKATYTGNEEIAILTELLNYGTRMSKDQVRKVCDGVQEKLQALTPPQTLK